MTEALTLYVVDDVILTIRGHKVILDRDLALLYGVEVKRLNEQMKRNQDRFPDDFAFRLTSQEVTNLKSQIATASAQRSRSQFATLKRGHNIKYRPHVFTEHGAIMAATVVNSSKEDPSAASAASRTRQDEDRLRCPRAESKILPEDQFEEERHRAAVENTRRHKMQRPLYRIL
jgi:hypothetical protein